MKSVKQILNDPVELRIVVYRAIEWDSRFEVWRHTDCILRDMYPWAIAPIMRGIHNRTK
jgi:hypothetical protein